MRNGLFVRCLCALAVLVPRVIIAQAIKPCDVIRAAEAAPLLGRTPTQGPSEGPVPDEKGVIRSHCLWMTGDRAIGVGVFRFASVRDAQRTMAEMDSTSRSTSDGVQLHATAGPGEQALWGTDAGDTDAWWFVRRGTTVVIISANEFTSVSRLRRPLEQLVVTALSRVPK